MTSSDRAAMIFRDYFDLPDDEKTLHDIAKAPAPSGNPWVFQGVPKEPLMTPKELAAHFKTTTSTILSWYHDGTIPAEVATGKVYRFDLERVSHALAKGAEKSVRNARDPWKIMVPTY